MQDAATITLERSEYERLHAEAARFRAEAERLGAEAAQLRAHNEWLLRNMFGRKTERFVPEAPGQLRFEFEGVEVPVETGQTVAQMVAAHERRKPAAEKRPHPGREAIPAHLRREETVLEPQGDTTGMARIGEDVTEVLEYKPGELYVRRTVRPRYARPHADQREGESPIVQAPAPQSPLGRSMAGTSLVAHIILGKYVEHLPLHRLIQRFARSGLKIKPQTIGGWVKTGGDLLDILYQAYAKWLFASTYLQMDETKIHVLEEGKKGECHLGYYWAVFDPVRRAAYFHYHPGRDHGLPLKLLHEFHGVLQCDGYGAYETVQKKRPGQIRLANCLAHIRREFFEAKGNDQKRAAEALAIIQKMYKVEEAARNLQLGPEARLALRQGELRPLFDLFKTWLDHNIQRTTPSSPIGKAIAYALNRWPNMAPILEDGRIEIDNNLVENTIRPIAIGRKNYLFAGSHESAKRAAAIYTFFAACKQADVNPEAWLTDVLNRIGDTKLTQLHTLFPQNWKPADNSGQEGQAQNG